MSGKYGTGWQITAWVGVPILVILVIIGAIGAAGEKFGWFEQNTAEPEQRPAAEVLVEDEINYGMQTTNDSSSDLEERLRRLARLRDQDLITAEDYEAQKQRLLDDA